MIKYFGEYTDELFEKIFQTDYNDLYEELGYESINEAYKVDTDFIQNHIIKHKNEILKLAQSKNARKVTGYMNKLFKDKFEFVGESKQDVDKVIKELKEEIEYRLKRIEGLKDFPTLRKSAELELSRTKQVLAAFKKKKDKSIKITYMTWREYHKFEQMNLIQKIQLWLYKRMFTKLTFREYKDAAWLPKIKHYNFDVIFGQYNILSNRMTIVFDKGLPKQLLKQQDDFDKFAMLITDILHHELIHRKEMLNSGVKEMKASRYNSRDMIAYLSDESELEAHAGQAYKQLKRQFNDKEIKTMLNNPLNSKYRLQLETSVAAGSYLRIIEYAPQVFLIFADKILDYMEEYYRGEDTI